MLITYVYHSGFILKGRNFAVLLDYFRDTPENCVCKHFLKFPGKLYILASHVHPDHFNPEILTWKSTRPDIQYILSDDIRKKIRRDIPELIFLKKGETWEDETIKIRAFGSTDVGISFLINAEDMTIFHAGDLNNWHWDEESTPEEIQKAETEWHQELDNIAHNISNIDIAMFPIDPRLGKNYMRGACEFISQIKVRNFIPMHCWEQYDKANLFKKYADQQGCHFININHAGEVINIE